LEVIFHVNCHGGLLSGGILNIMGLGCVSVGINILGFPVGILGVVGGSWPGKYSPQFEKRDILAYNC
jgi:hypothetical protein